MSSRGSVAENGHVLTNEYETVYVTKLGVKVLKGIGEKHSMPEYSHSSNSIYAKLKTNGELQALKFFDENKMPIIEIAYHPESKINYGNRQDSILHFHTFEGIDRKKEVYRMDEQSRDKRKI